MESPKVSVVLSYIRSERTIGRCLEALHSQDYPNYEAVVINAKDYGNCSEARGQNIGIAKSSGEIVMFTNSDCYVPKDWITRAVRRLQEGYDIVGGQPFWMGDVYAMAWNPPFKRYWDTRLGLGFSCAAAWRRWVEDGIPEGMSFQDGIWFFQATQKGAKPYIDRDLIVDHDHRFLSLAQSFRRAFSYEYGLFLIVRMLYKDMVGQSSPIGIGSLKNQMKEALMIDGVRAWQDWGLGRWVSLPRFLFLRTLGFKVPSVLGMLKAMRAKQPSFSLIPDTHVNARKGIG